MLLPVPSVTLDRLNLVTIINTKNNYSTRYLKQWCQNSGASIAVFKCIDQLRQNTQSAEWCWKEVQRWREIVEEIILCFLILNLSKSSEHSTSAHLKFVSRLYFCTTNSVNWLQVKRATQFTATIQVNLRLPAPPVKKWRILLTQSCTARMPLLAATSAFGLRRRRWSSPQQCYVYCSLLQINKLQQKHLLDHNICLCSLAFQTYNTYTVN